MSLQGQTALITGGAKNLGALVATQLAAEGANVAIHYHGDSSAKDAESLISGFEEKYPKIKAKSYQGDLSGAADVHKLFESVLQDFGQLNIVVNTVGMVLKKPLVDISEAEYDAMFAVNSKSAFFITQEAAKAVQDRGKIINIVTGLLAAYAPMYSLYQGSKAPVEWYTKALSKELLSRGVSVNAIAPGPMDTPFFYGQETPDSIAFLKSGSIDGRLTHIEDIAPIVKFLATEGHWITDAVREWRLHHSLNGAIKGARKVSFRAAVDVMMLSACQKRDLALMFEIQTSFVEQGYEYRVHGHRLPEGKRITT